MSHMWKQLVKICKVDWFWGYIYRYTPRRYAPVLYVENIVSCSFIWMYICLQSWHLIGWLSVRSMLDCWLPRTGRLSRRTKVQVETAPVWRRSEFTCCASVLAIILCVVASLYQCGLARLFQSLSCQHVGCCLISLCFMLNHIQDLNRPPRQNLYSVAKSKQWQIICSAPETLCIKDSSILTPTVDEDMDTTNTMQQGQGHRSHRIIGGHKRRLVVWGTEGPQRGPGVEPQ